MGRSTLIAVAIVVALSLIGGLALFDLRTFYAVVLALVVLLAIVYALLRRSHTAEHDDW